MAKYKKCPRCELNYIEEDKDYCDVCLAEMQGGRLRFADSVENLPAPFRIEMAFQVNLVRGLLGVLRD